MKKRTLAIKNHPTKKQLRKECLKLLREITMIRDKGRCVFCGTTKDLQLSHIYPKGRHRSLELEPDNVKMLCVRDHLYFFHKSPVEAWERLREVLPPERLERLKLMSQTAQRVDLKIWLIYLKKVLAEFQQ